MTDQENARLREVLKTIVPKISRDRDRRMNEENTKNNLIDPVLEALGWNVRDCDEVDHEFRATPSDNPVDYALKILCKPKLFIEAKGLGENLADHKWITQVLHYAADAGVKWCVLSDGDEYVFYNSTAEVLAEEKKFCRVRLSESSEDDAVNALAPLCRSDLNGSLIEERWTVHFVDRRVKATLCELLSPPDNALVRLIRGKLPELQRNDILASFSRLHIHIDSAPTPPPPPPSSPPTDGERASIAQLIQAGILTASTKLFAPYKETEFEATILPDGGVEFKGTRYGTPSAAGAAAKSTITGKKMSTDGWDFWQVRDSGGQVHKLAELRTALKGKEA